MGAILVTGGAGFIGSHLVERLLSGGRRVVALDNFDRFYAADVKERNLEAASRHPSFRLVRGDIRDAAALRTAFSGEPFDVVVHLAAKAGVRPSIEDPQAYVSVNVDGTSHLLEAVRRHRVPVFVFGSSSSVYGNNPKVPFSEADPVDHPISPYAATKRAGELLAHTYHHLFSVKVACLRFFTVYGPRQRPDLAIHKFTRLMAEDRPIPVYGDGTAGRDYTYVDDIVDGIVRAAERAAGFDIWNLGGSQPVRLEDLVGRIAGRLGVTPRIDRQPAQPGDVQTTWADIASAGRDLHWAPRTGFDDGMDRFIAWFQAERADRSATGSAS